MMNDNGESEDDMDTDPDTYPFEDNADVPIRYQRKAYFVGWSKKAGNAYEKYAIFASSYWQIFYISQTIE